RRLAVQDTHGVMIPDPSISGITPVGVVTLGACFVRAAMGNTWNTSGLPPAPPAPDARYKRSDYTVIVLGVILLIIGFVVGIPVLWTIGVILALAGVVLAVLGGTGRRVGGRAHWY